MMSRTEGRRPEIEALLVEVQSRAYNATPVNKEGRKKGCLPPLPSPPLSIDLVLDMQAEHLEGLFHHEIDPLHEIALMIRGKRQIEGFQLVRFQREAGGCHVDRATEIGLLFLVNQRPVNVPFVPRYYLEQWRGNPLINNILIRGFWGEINYGRIVTKSVWITG